MRRKVIDGRYGSSISFQTTHQGRPARTQRAEQHHATSGAEAQEILETGEEVVPSDQLTRLSGFKRADGKRVFLKAR